MLPAVNKNEELTAHLNLNPSAKKMTPRKKEKKKWLDEYKLLGISTPQLLQGDNKKKMYKMSFTYKSLLQNKIRSHVVYFGQVRDYIFSKDKQARLKRILSLKNIDNPFHSDYWTAHLANKYETLKEGLEKFNQFFISNDNAAIQQKIVNRLKKPFIQ